MTLIRKIKLAFLTIIATMLTALVIQNTEITTVRFLRWETEISRILLLTFVALAGFIAGVLTTLLLQRRHHKKHPDS